MRGNSGEGQLWQTVLFQGLKDALEGANQAKPKLDWVVADRWIRGGGKDFRLVCSLAGLDPEIVRNAYRSGRISLELLVMSETGNRRSLARELQDIDAGGRLQGRRAIGAGR